MKTLLLSFLVFLSFSASAQITTPVVRAFFGVDADLKGRSVNGTLQSSDDWYIQPGTAGTSTNGTNVIDTTGAAAILAGYATDVSPWPKRMTSFYRTMSRPSFTVVNNRLWLDALFVRDYHGNDTTVFTAGADKNGQSPGNWSGGVQGIPDKNDILDMFMHVRRAGPTASDSLWFFGGLSLDNVTGNRYFDFEMYQTDIYYDRSSLKWYGYGPDAGHTSWVFDASGNVTRPGDIIFSAEYQSSSLTNIEARIWIDKSSLLISPAQFNWSGQFDGAAAGAQYGYASILPKTAGAFYTGLQCGNNEWAGAFSVVLQDNAISTNYNAKQFMEFSVNLTKLGLDPVSIFGGDICGTPFNRMVVKTRASASFTSELKDFIAPTDLFLAPRAEALADVPIFCGNPNNVSNIEVINPQGNSVYTWATTDGNIVGDPVSTIISADAPGTYIVTQQLMAGCSVYASDTVVVLYEEDCTTLESNKINFNASLKNKQPVLHWTSYINESTNYYEVQRSSDGKNFETIERIINNKTSSPVETYSFIDKEPDNNQVFYYRIKVINYHSIIYSRILSIEIKAENNLLSMLPNPASNYVKITIPSIKNQGSTLAIYNIAGELLYTRKHDLKEGINTITVQDLNRWRTGVYMVQLSSANLNHWQKLIIGR